MGGGCARGVCSVCPSRNPLTPIPTQCVLPQNPFARIRFGRGASLGQVAGFPPALRTNGTLRVSGSLVVGGNVVVAAENLVRGLRERATLRPFPTALVTS
jgi:hypothetical protein